MGTHTEIRRAVANQSKNPPPESKQYCRVKVSGQEEEESCNTGDDANSSFDPAPPSTNNGLPPSTNAILQSILDNKSGWAVDSMDELLMGAVSNSSSQDCFVAGPPSEEEADETS